MMNNFIFLLVFIGNVNNKCVVADYTEVEPIIDGSLVDSIWAQNSWYSGFIAIEPQYKQVPTNRTEFAILYSKKKFFIGVRCYYKDKPVSKILKRDNYDEQEDGVRILFDPDYTKTRYYLFGLNYLNVQTDGIGRQGYGDLKWDGIWESRITDYDSFYVIEIAIPFECFACPLKDTIGFNIIRSEYGNSEISSWADVGSQFLNPLFFGKLVIASEKLITEKVLFSYPYFTFRYLQEEDYIRMAAGGEIFWQLKSNRLGFTYDPEYCELEPDADVISLVAGSEVYLAEKRPFFLEGFDLYSWNLFYTRRISEIHWASKIFGKVGDRDYNLFFIKTKDTTQFAGVASDGNLSKSCSYNFGLVSKKREELKSCVISSFLYRPIKELSFDITTRLNHQEDFFFKEATSVSLSSFYTHPSLSANISLCYHGAHSFPEFGYYGISLPYNQYKGTISLKPKFCFRKIIKEYSPSGNISYTLDNKGVRIKESESFSNYLKFSPDFSLSISANNIFIRFPTYEIHNRLLTSSVSLGRKSLLSLGGIYGFQNDNRLIMPIITTSGIFGQAAVISLSFQNKYLWTNDSLRENVRLVIFKIRFKPLDIIEMRAFCQYSDLAKILVFNYVAKIRLLHNAIIYLAFLDNEDISAGVIENTARRVFLKGIYSLSF